LSKYFSNTGKIILKMIRCENMGDDMKNSGPLVCREQMRLEINNWRSA
jgi:hypothetical protein